MDEQRKEIIRQSLREFTPNPNNIDGIFNYCDRWCERCRFTSRCTQWQMENSVKSDVKDSIEESMEYVSIVMQDSIERIYKELEERGIDISDVDNTAINESKQDSPLEVMGRDYFRNTLKWLDENADGLKAYSITLMSISEERSKMLSDAIEIINWYMSMIGVKISRALRSDPFDEDDFVRQDRIATGRLVLVCIEKSIKALMYLMENYPNSEDPILALLTQLAQMRSGLIVELPEAKDYRRPYLDA